MGIVGTPPAPPRARIIALDRYNRVREARDYDRDVNLSMVRNSTVEHRCEAYCGRRIMDGASYARVVYPRNSAPARRVWGGAYPIELAYHWECTPDEVLTLLPLFFPNQEWKART